MSLLKSHYGNVQKVISEVVTLCNYRKVQAIEPKSRSCRQRYPCGGHGGAVITFENNEIAYYPCSSVDLGIIMYYYGVDNDHFTNYVDEDLRNLLTESTSIGQ